MGRTIKRALLIVVGGVALGLAANALSPRGIPYITPPKPTLQPDETISLQEAESLWASGMALFLDARAPDDFTRGHIANAFSLPLEDFDSHFPQVAMMLSTDMPIVVYCDGEQCELSHKLALRLKQLGYSKARVLVNGWTVWRQAGLPTAIGGSQ